MLSVSIAFEMSDNLVEIVQEHWKTLRNLFSPENPENYLCYCLLDNYIRWLEKEPESVDVVFYSLNNDWSDGTFIAIWKSENDRDIFYVNGLGNQRDHFVRILLLVDFSRGFLFKSLTENTLAAVLEVIKSKNLKYECDFGSLYHLSQSKALSVQIMPPEGPEGITLKQLAPSDVNVAHEEWLHRSPESLKLFKKISRLNPCVGAFNSDGRMIAWALRWPLGTIGALHVDEEYRKRGLGALVTKAISQKIAEIGHDVGAGVALENAPAHALFEKLGFSRVSNLYWVFNIHATD